MPERAAAPRPTWRQRLARLLDPARQPPRPARQARMYAGARQTNTTLGFGSSGATSADAELATSLQMLRQRSRQLVRDSAYAKRAKMIVQNNVVGSGVGLQAQVRTTRGDMAKAVNDGIEAAWRAWCTADSCHTGGSVHFGDMERMALGQVFEAGEVFIRLHRRPFGTSRVPLALELIEAERLAGELVNPPAAFGIDNEVRLGVEVDDFKRPVAYWIRSGHPGDIRSRVGAAERYERVPAADILHLRIVDRWPQTRGEPWMHATMRKLDDVTEYSQCEVTAARASAAYFASVKHAADETADPTGPDGTRAPSEPPTITIEPLTVLDLEDGAELDFHAPNRPNAAFAEFMRSMLREIAAGVGVSYESLSRDYSQSNYSSSRLALLDDRDLWRMLQQWWVRAFREPLHRIWLQQAVLAGAVPAVPVGAYAADPMRYEAVLFKCRGWSWVDPTKEVDAYKEAVKAGFTTVTDVIAQTAGGMDIEDVIATRERELEMFEEAGIAVDTTVAEPAAPVPAAAPGTPRETAAPAEGDDAEDDDDAPQRARVLRMRATA